jgi:hypothetical protein
MSSEELQSSRGEQIEVKVCRNCITSYSPASVDSSDATRSDLSMS